MLLRKRKMVLIAVLLAALGVAAGLIADLAPSRSDAAAKRDKTPNEKPAAKFTLAEFNKLKPMLDVKNQPWTTIPWKYSITEARKLAAKTKKPIFMVVNTGNALGCV